MIVTEANEYAGNVHERTPVFLAEHSFASWLDGSELSRPAPENLLHMWPVSRRVNRSSDGIGGPTLLDRIEPSAACGAVTGDLPVRPRSPKRPKRRHTRPADAS
jgi:SOS response associated peptidase (SRAP)